MGALAPPIEPMLAQLSHELPGEGYLYEPKWDGFRCLAFVAEAAGSPCGRAEPGSANVDLRSRHQRPLARYFPELVEGLCAVASPPFVLDGEIVIAGPRGFDFPALLGRLHPSASRVERLRAEMPATFVAFDLLAAGGDDLRARRFDERRARLEALLTPAPPHVVVTPATERRELAREWLDRSAGAGIDGVVAKRRDLPYQSGRRAMTKVKKERTADCVVAGLRVALDEGVPLVASLLLGLYEDGPQRSSAAPCGLRQAAGGSRRLLHVGVSSTFTGRKRRELFLELRPRIVPLEGHPWERGFNLGRSPTGRLKGSAGRWDPAEMEQDWVPLRPDLVCEVRYDQLDAGRFRHPAKFLRWRPDREARSCAFDQLAIVSAEPPWN
jgi:ATP-dependent DNA ligase